MNKREKEEHYRILFVLEHFHPYIGGAERLSYLLTKKLAEEGYEVQVLTTLHDQKLKKVEVVEGVHIRRINCKNRFLFTLRALRPARELAKHSDIIIGSTYNAAIPTWWAAKKNLLPSILIFHEIWDKLWFRLPYLNLIQRIAYWSFEQVVARLHFTKIVAVSEYTREGLKKYFSGEKIVRIYNGIDYSEFEGYKWQAPNKFQPLFLGRLGVSKGIDILIPAMDQFLGRHRDSSFRLILPNQPKALSRRIRNAIKSLKHSDRIELIQSLEFEKLLDTMCQSSCIVIPSYSEGFGFVAVEAAAMGIPVISSELGALSETVSGRYIGMEVHSSEGLLQALESARKAYWLKKEVKHFELEQSTNQYISLIKNSVKSKHKNH